MTTTAVQGRWAKTKGMQSQQLAAQGPAASPFKLCSYAAARQFDIEKVLLISQSVTQVYQLADTKLQD